MGWISSTSVSYVSPGYESAAGGGFFLSGRTTFGIVGVGVGVGVGEGVATFADLVPSLAAFAADLDAVFGTATEVVCCLAGFSGSTNPSSTCGLGVHCGFCEAGLAGTYASSLPFGAVNSKLAVWGYCGQSFRCVNLMRSSVMTAAKIKKTR